MRNTIGGAWRQNRRAKRKNKKKQKDDGIVTRYILDRIDFHTKQLKGFGPTKAELTETFTIVDKRVGDVDSGRDSTSVSKQRKSGLKGGTSAEGRGRDGNKSDFYYFAVYDGHGSSAKDAAFSASDYV